MPTAGRHRAVLRTGLMLFLVGRNPDGRFSYQLSGFPLEPALDLIGGGNDDRPLSATADALARRSSDYLGNLLTDWGASPPVAFFNVFSMNLFIKIPSKFGLPHRFLPVRLSLAYAAGSDIIWGKLNSNRTLFCRT